MLPPVLVPQLCTLSPATHDGDSWLHEIKYDGWRPLARKDGKHVRLFSRGGHEGHAHLPELGDESRLFYQAWDMPWRNTRDLSRVPLIERKAVLAEMLTNARARVRYTSHTVGEGRAFFDRVNALDLEGIVSKHVESRYAPGERTRDRLKVKCWRTHHVVVGGIERDETDRVVALLVGSPDGERLRYEGRVEFGLYRVRDAWRSARAIRRSPFADDLRGGRRTWLAPRMALDG
jgi:bifunctional non-homologous end joining protein LigD